MPIKSGIGFGEAQVFDTSGLVNTFGKIVAQQQKQSAKYQQDLADVIASVKTDGIRDIDKQDFIKYYEEVKDLNRQANTLKNDRDRIQALATLKERVGSLNDFAARSKDLDKRLGSLSATIAPNVWAYDPKKVDQIKKLKTTPLSQVDPGVSLDQFDYLPMVDSSVREKRFNNIYSSEEKRLKGSEYIPEDVKGVGRRLVGIGNKNRVINDIYADIITDPKYKALAFTQYVTENPDNPVPDMEDVVANELKKYEQEKGYRYQGAPQFKPKETTSAESKEQQAVVQRKTLVDRLVNRVPGSEKEFLNLSSLPYGTDVKFIDVRKNGKVIKKLFKVVVPKSGWESAVASNPVLAEYGFGTDDASGKTKVFEFDVSSPDARRGINVFIDQFSPGKNVSYDKIGEPTQAKRKEIKESEIPAMAKSKNYSVAEYTKELQKNGIKIIK